MFNWFRKSTVITTNTASVDMTDTLNSTPNLSKGTPSQDQQAENRIRTFVGEQPQAMYLIDGKKGTEKSIICRKNENGGQTCLNLDISSITLFKKMQSQNYFCSLPLKVTDTHFECRRIQ